MEPSKKLVDIIAGPGSLGIRNSLLSTNFSRRKSIFRTTAIIIDLSEIFLSLYTITVIYRMLGNLVENSANLR